MGDFSVADADMEAADDRSSLEMFWQLLIAGKEGKAAHIYQADAELRLPQSEEKFVGRAVIAESGILKHGEKLTKINSIFGRGNVWISECEGRLHRSTILVISIVEMDDGEIVAETRYWSPKEPRTPAKKRT